MKKTICIILILIFFISILSPVLAEDRVVLSDTLPEITAAGAFVLDLGKNLNSDDDNTIIFQKSYTEKFAPASLTKIMTAVVLLDKYSETELKNISCTLSQKTKNYIFELGAETSGIEVGETLFLYDLLACMLLPSGCDASQMIAEKMGNGGADEFVSLMNTKAYQLGLTSTYFVNPTGLQDPLQYTTISNLELLVKYAYYKMKNKELFKNLVSLTEYTLPKTNKQPERIIRNTNLLISDKNQKIDGILGVKTGFTSEAGRCLITIYKDNEFELLTIVMKSANNVNGKNAFTDTANLINWTKENIIKVDITKISSPVLTVKLSKAEKGIEKVNLEFNSSIEKMIDKVYLDKIVIRPYKNIDILVAPLKRGEVITSADILLNDTIIATADLVVTNDINKDIKYILLDSLVFIIPIMCGVIIIIIIFYITKRKKQKKSRTVFR